MDLSTSRQQILDYCNSLLYGTSVSNINKLQRVQNQLARLVVGANRSEPAHRLLSKLHWLPIRHRIDYKIALLTFKVLHSSQPVYLHQLLTFYRPSRSLRSSQHFILQNSHFNSVFSSRAFCHSAPRVWNSLPYDLTDVFNSVSEPVFKRRLKTFLFSKFFTG